MATGTEVKLSGTLFERPQPVLDYHINVMTRDAANDAQLAVKFQGQSSFRYEHSAPTGEWARSIKTRQSRAATGRFQSGWAVHDSGIIYGPWLEGVSPRNATTSFKGYSMFRKVAQEIERKAPQMLAPQIRRMVKELNR
ncbi:MAG: hypothetical protein U9N84_01635 [Actinomycetota bacterium]|nr:hypothetical protein [Actinomycetota bacterium]